MLARNRRQSNRLHELELETGKSIRSHPMTQCVLISAVQHSIHFISFHSYFSRKPVIISADQSAKMFSLLTLFTSLAVAMSLPLDLETRQTTTVCAKGVHIIAARGSTQPPGEGSLQSLSALIQSAIPGSTSSAVVYPALLDPYNSSEEQGVANMLLLIQQYVTSCPKAKLVLTGYSQGAQIIGDALGGGSFINSAPLAEVYRKNSMCHSWLRCVCTGANDSQSSLAYSSVIRLGRVLNFTISAIPLVTGYVYQSSILPQTYILTIRPDFPSCQNNSIGYLYR